MRGESRASCKVSQVFHISLTDCSVNLREREELLPPSWAPSAPWCWSCSWSWTLQTAITRGRMRTITTTTRTTITMLMREWMFCWMSMKIWSLLWVWVLVEVFLLMMTLRWTKSCPTDLKSFIFRIWKNIGKPGEKISVMKQPSRIKTCFYQDFTFKLSKKFLFRDT